MIVQVGLLVVSAILLAACGTPTEPSDPRTPAAPTASQGTPAPGGDEGAFPVVVTRIGGIVGFDDRVTVQASGSTTVTTKRGAAPSCTLTDAAVARLAAAAAVLSTAPPPTSSGRRISDDLVTSLQSPLTRGAVRVVDASSDSLAVVGELLADVTGDPPAHTLCR